MADILKLVSPEQFYIKISRIEVNSENEDEWFARCPFHDDRKRSLSVNKITGSWVCYGSCSIGGGIVGFHAKKHGLTNDEALLDLKISLGKEKAVPAAKVQKAHERLLKSKPVLEILRKKRGLTLDTVKKFELGYDGERIWIPIRVGTHYLNVRKYDYLGRNQKEKMVSWDVGFGAARLFPQSSLAAQTIMISEGETDCMLANQMGFSAVTVTGGAGTWPSKFNPSVAGKDVVICYDIDEAGVKGAEKVAKAIGRLAKSVKIIRLPISEPKNADLTDYIVGHGYTAADLRSLIAKTEPQRTGQHEQKLDPTLHKVNLHEASDERYYLKRVEVPVIVSGKDLAPYFVPKKIKWSCGMGLKKCGGCGLGPNGAEGEMVIEIESPTDILQLIGVNEMIQETALKRKAGIVPCNLPQLEVLKAQNVEEIRVIPEIEFASKNTEYVTRQVFVLGKAVKTNSSYTMRGVTVPDPKTQYATQVIDQMEPNQLSIDQFKMNPALQKELKIFQPKRNQSIKSKLADIYQDLTYNVTQIYGREDMLQAMDLVYHSVIKFKLLGRSVTRGWCEALILGDARCGKSESIEAIVNHYRSGEIVTGENTSFAGLIGGMSQVQNRWSISWGKIPLADRRLIAIDEVSGMDIDHISLMSGVRSSGVAEVVKIQAEKTNARTRLLWFSNPRSGRRLDSYNHGVIAIKELIGRVEDIARFDLAVTTASGEVPTNIAYEVRNKKFKHIYTSPLCRSLVMWAWSRSSDNIKFDTGAEKEIFASVEILDKKYSSAIPLVEAAEQRVKIARMAVSMACRLFSTKNGEDVIVTKEHVQHVVRFLQQCYDKPSMGYDLFSKAVKRVDTIPEENRPKLIKEFKLFDDWDVLRDILLEAGPFRRGEIMDQVGYDPEQARVLFKWLGRWRLIRPTPVGYVKTSGFTSFLKNITNDKPTKGNKGDQF